MMKRRKRWGCLAVILLLTIVAAVFGLHWAWKYYGLPEWPDRREYKTIEERAEKALAWDFHQKKIVASTYVMHGPGCGSTAEHPVFSNKPGSECSSLGRFLVTKEHGYTLKRSFRIKGLDMDNQSAYARGLMIHKSGWVDSHCWMRYIPLHRASCQGCVTVSSRGMNYLWSLVNKEKKPILLWNFESHQ